MHTKLLRPHFAFRSIADIDFKWLRSLGIKRYLIDLDGTLVPWLSMYLDPRYIEKLNEAINEGWIEDIAIFSNAGLVFFVPRVALIARRLDMKWYASYWPNPLKPTPASFRAALALIGGGEDAAIIGDQIVKDIAGGHTVGIKTILVESLNLPIIGRSYLPDNARQIRELGIEFICSG